MLTRYILALMIFASGVLLPAGLSAQQDYDELQMYLYPEESPKISMDFKDASLNNVLKIFSQQSGMNFIAATEVADKRINLYLDEVPVELALERILSAHDLTYELKPGSNIFVVKQLDKPERELMTRVYQLEHATIPSSKLTKTFQSDGAEKSGDGEDTANILTAIQSILTPNGIIVEEPRTNSLIITDIPSQFSSIDQTIARLDVRTPQILIEVEMLDISKNSAELLGAKIGDTPFTFRGSERDGVFPFDFDNFVSSNVEEAIPGAVNDLFEDGRYRFSTVSFSGLSYIVNLLRTQTDTRNLARPRILTLNNQTAEIQISADEAIGIRSVETAAEGLGTSSTEAERALTGVFLVVTPQANMKTREITMAIEPKVVQAKTAGGFAGADQFKDAEERGTKSVLRIRDGDTIIIGGLLRNNHDEVRTRVPFLADIPFLGAAFRHKDFSESQRELVIFITPHIIREDEEISPSSMLTLQREQTPSMSSPSRNREISNELAIFENQ